MKRQQKIFNGIFLWLGLLVLGFWAQSHYEVLRYLFFLRMPIIIGLLVIFLPIISTRFLAPMLKSLFVLRTQGQIILSIAGAVIAGMATVLVFNIILANANLRFNVKDVTPIPELWQYIIAIAISLPISLTVISLSRKEMQIREYVKGILFGGVLGTFLLISSYFLNHFLESSNVAANILKSGIYILPKAVQRGYIDAKGNLAPGIIPVTAFLLVMLIVYAVGYFLFKPQPQANRFEAPALIYVMQILSTMALLLGGMSYFLDFSRVPVLLIFVLISAVSYRIFEVDHFYKIYEQKEPKKPAHDSWKKAVYKRLEKQGENKTLVVVCASGGGIQAAGWTTKVLTGLQTEINCKFTQAIGWISSVSGGSVGTMYYLDRFGENGYPHSSELSQIFDSATKDSLDATGWGLAYPDLFRFIGIPFLVNKEQDRGTAIEIDWKGEMKHPNACLASWCEKIEQGTLPIPIFNATLVEDGRRFLISPMTLDRETNFEADCKCTDFNTLYPEYDINVTTAARLSATFPYVSPVSRPNVDTGKNFHVADGGYFDNFGVCTSVQLLERLLNPEQPLLRAEKNPIERVIFLQINAFPDSTIRDENPGAPGWRMEVAGSIEALLNVRSSTQTASSQVNIKLLAEKWKHQGVKIEHIVVAPEADTSFQAPLSWTLTQEEKDNIGKAWDKVKADVVNKIYHVWPELSEQTDIS